MARNVFYASAKKNINYGNYYIAKNMSEYNRLYERDVERPRLIKDLASAIQNGDMSPDEFIEWYNRGYEITKKVVESYPGILQNLRLKSIGSGSQSERKNNIGDSTASTKDRGVIGGYTPGSVDRGGAIRDSGRSLRGYRN